jgi:hypothetical protein
MQTVTFSSNVDSNGLATATLHIYGRTITVLTDSDDPLDILKLAQSCAENRRKHV